MIEFRANGVNLTGDIQSENTALNIANESFSDRLRPVGTFTDFNISLPSSAVNDSILEVAGIKDFEVLFYGTPIAIGTARVVGAIQQGNSYVRTGARWTLQTNLSNADWIDRLRLVRLNELDWSDADHVMNDATVLARLSVAYDTHRFGYHLARTREWPLNTRARVQDFTPFVWLRDAIEKSMNAVGYTINDTGGFINSALMKSLAMPLPLLRDNIEWAIDSLNAIVDRITTAQEITVTNNDFGVNFPLIFNNVVIDTGGNTALVSGQERYYINFTGEFVVTIEAIYETQEDAAAANVTFSHELQLFNDSGFVSAVVFEGGALGLSQNVETPFTSTAVINVNSLLLNPYLRVVIKPLSITAGVDGDPRLIDFLTGSRLIIESLQADMGNRPIDVAGLIPDEWSPLDMIRDLFFIFCGRSNNNEFIKLWDIEPADNYETAAGLSDGYYLDSGQYRVKADLSKEAKIDYREIDITAVQFDWMRASEDATMEGEEERQQTEFYSGLVQLSSNLPAKIEQRTTEFFAKTLQIEDTDIRAGRQKIPLIPVYADFDIRRENSFLLPESFTPRLLIYKYFASGDDANGLANYQNTSGSFEPAVRVPFMTMVNYYDTTGHSDSLSFMDETIPFGTVKGLMNTFHRHDLARLQVGTELTEYLIYPITRLLQPQPFRNKILVGDRMYIVKGVRSFRGGLPSQQVVLVPDAKAGDTFTVIPKGKRAVANAVSTGNEIELIGTPIIIEDVPTPPDWVSGPAIIQLTVNNTIWYVDHQGDSVQLNIVPDGGGGGSSCKRVTGCGAEFTFALHDENAVFLDTQELIVTGFLVSTNQNGFVTIKGSIEVIEGFWHGFEFTVGFGNRNIEVTGFTALVSATLSAKFNLVKALAQRNKNVNPTFWLESDFEDARDFSNSGGTAIRGWRSDRFEIRSGGDFWFSDADTSTGKVRITASSSDPNANGRINIGRAWPAVTDLLAPLKPELAIGCEMVGIFKINTDATDANNRIVSMGISTYMEGTTYDVWTNDMVAALRVYNSANVWRVDGRVLTQTVTLADSVPASDYLIYRIVHWPKTGTASGTTLFSVYDRTGALQASGQITHSTPLTAAATAFVLDAQRDGVGSYSVDVDYLGVGELGGGVQKIMENVSLPIRKLSAQVIISGTNLQDVECEDITFNLGCSEDPDCPTLVDEMGMTNFVIDEMGLGICILDEMN